MKKRQDYTAASIFLSPNTSELASTNVAAGDRIWFWDVSQNKWTFLTVGTGLTISGTTLDNTGAPSDADYLVKTANASLSAERVVTDTTSITVDWATAGQAKFQREALTGNVTASQNSNTTAIDKTAITDKTTVTAATDDLILISDTSDAANLKKVTAQTIANLASSGSSGTYTPTLTNTTNIASSTAYTCQYMQVGSVVTVSGKFDIDPTAAAATVMGISLPVASNFASEQQCGGTAVWNTSTNNAGGSIKADAANDRARLDFYANTDVSNSWFFTFTYLVV